MSAQVTVAGIRCISARFVLPYVGVWFAELDIDPDLVSEVPTLPISVPIVIASTPPVTLIGTIDPLASGSFGQTARLRVIGGNAGWQQSVPAQHFHSDGGLTTAMVYAATGATVGELVTVIVPSLLGQDYVRLAGPASNVLQDEDWWVDIQTPTTFVGPRPPAIPDPSLEVMSWDASTLIAEVRCDTLVMPGTPLVDLRIGGEPKTVRDVEQFFDGSGSVAQCMTSPNTVSRLRAALGTLVRAYAKTGFLKCALYRFVTDVTSPTKVALQAVARDPATQLASPFPDMIPITTWTGVPGMTADMPPSLEVIVAFVDETQPVIIGYSTLAPPLKTTIDAAVEIDIGILAPLISIGGPSAQLLATAAGVAALIGALTTFAAALGSATTIVQAAAAGTALNTALGGLPPVATTKTKAA